MNGMTHNDIENMLSSDRMWYIKRLEKQKIKESKDINPKKK
jgi:hypothetical protein